jgi:hypothetical protein
MNGVNAIINNYGDFLTNFWRKIAVFWQKQLSPQDRLGI